MSTEIENEHLPEGFTLTQFWGGAERGQCVQLTGPQGSLEQGLTGFVQLTPEQARAIAVCLLEWAETVKPGCEPLTEAQRQRLHRKVREVFKS